MCTDDGLRFGQRLGNFLKRCAKSVAIAFTILLLGALLSAVILPEHTNIAMGAALVLALIGLLALFRKLNKFHLDRLAGLSALLMGLGFFVSAGDEVHKREEQMLAELRSTDIETYLTKLKELRSDETWLDELEQLKPEAHQAELAKRAEIEQAEEQRRAQAEEERRNRAFRQKCEDRHLAWTFAKEAIKQQLKSPSTARFPFAPIDQITYLGNCTHRIASYVDAQNSFGARLRQHYVAKMKYSKNGYWSLVSLKM